MARTAVIVALVALLAVAHVEAARELKASISGCTSYRTIAGGKTTCAACSGGLIPGPLGDSCVKASVSSGPVGLANCASVRTLGGGRKACSVCSPGFVLNGEACISASRPTLG